MTTQLDLLKSKSPTVSEGEVEWLIGIINKGRWMKSKEIVVHPNWLKRYGYKYLSWRERKLRAIASASKGRVLSWPGSPGYKLTCQATPLEIQKAHKLQHQANEMAGRYVEIMNCWHSCQTK